MKKCLSISLLFLLPFPDFIQCPYTLYINWTLQFRKKWEGLCKRRLWWWWRQWQEYCICTVFGDFCELCCWMDKNEPWCLLFYCYSYKLPSLFTSHHLLQLFSSVFRLGSASINVKFHYGIHATTFFPLGSTSSMPLRPFYHIRFYIATSHYTPYACTARITRQLGLPHFTRIFF